MPTKKTTIKGTVGVTITRKYPDEIKAVPSELLNIRFDDLITWLYAYTQKRYSEADVLRAVIYAFRRRYFYSQAAACKMLGISKNSLNRWELGKAEIRLETKRNLIVNGWFKPQHFGMDIDAQKFIADIKEMEGNANA
jgi:DNA-binding XRE family transcriptional regulator